MRRRPGAWFPTLLLTALAFAGGQGRALAWQDPNDPNAAPPGDLPPGVQVLTRGPLNEAFAEPIVYDPQPGPVIPKEPPPPVQEVPPAEQPVGANVRWIPGYWAWDDNRGDFLWVSGVWRDVPPDRQWIPGYWAQAEGGFRWVPGAWVSAQSTGVEYLPAPPQSLEAGPTSAPPSEGATWSPGTWVWQDNTYVWQPGFWVPYQPDWVWSPSHYLWSPGGYQYVNGYWDRPLEQRGTPFAPVYFSQPVYRQPNFAFTPTVGLLASGLASSLFVRPSHHQYYFGDYYAANNFQSGIYPWYSYHQSRYGSDPLFAQYAATNVRSNPQFLQTMHQDYQYRREHAEARPPHNYNEFRQYQARPTSVNTFTNTNVRNLSFAQPVRQLAREDRGRQGPQYRTLDEPRRREAAAQAAQVHQYREQRSRQDFEAARARPLPDRNAGVRPEGFTPHRVERPISPVVAARPEAPGPRPPARPEHPPFQPEMRPRPAAEAHPLPRPTPEMRPMPNPPRYEPRPGPAGPRPEARPPAPRPEFRPAPRPEPRPQPPAARPGPPPGAPAEPRKGQRPR